jgi:hypothetical protein
MKGATTSMNTTKVATGSGRKRKLDEAGSPTLGKGKGLKNDNGKQDKNNGKSKDLGDKATQELGGKPTQEEGPPEEDACVICMEEKGGTVGKLECCQHTFCASCILKVILLQFLFVFVLVQIVAGIVWTKCHFYYYHSPPLRILSLQWSKTSNTCPICVRRFKTVTEVCEARYEGGGLLCSPSTTRLLYVKLLQY